MVQRLPSPTHEYDQKWASNLVRGTERELVTLTDNVRSLAPVYGNFYDTTTQTAAAINTAYAMTYNTTDKANTSGVAIVSNSRITFGYRGTFNLQFSAQFVSTSGSIKNIYIWLRKNGADVPYSATTVTTSGSNAAIVAAWNFLINGLASDYYEIMWSTSDTNVSIQASGASSPVPAIPSIILTVWRIST